QNWMPIEGQFWTPIDTHRIVMCTWKHVRKKVTYMLKAPVKTYRAYPMRDNDGRIIDDFWQRKQPHRPGQALAVCRFMHGAEIDKLCIAGGEAVGVIEDIAARAKARIESQDRQQLKDLQRSLGLPRRRHGKAQT
ncbi:hypothetical protein, partial [Mesorhizobium sp. M0296]|uniref:hypothetical protein n=1 Tax=Mesorhizobium sp. M0296 TaxID=2956931 RepID=UPI00333D8D5B